MENIRKLLLLWNIGAIFRRTQVKVMLDYLDLENARKILDAGCGQGLVDYEIIRRTRSRLEIILLDLSYNDLAIARELLKLYDKGNVHLVTSSLTHLPFRDKVFDRILLSSVLQHVPDYKRALREVSRTSTINSVLVVNVPSSECYIYLRKILGEEVKRKLYNMYSMVKDFSILETLRELISIGFRPVKYVFKPSLASMLVFELTSLIKLLLGKASIANRIVLALSILYPITSWIEEKLGLTTGTEYIVKAIKTR